MDRLFEDDVWSRVKALRKRGEPILAAIAYVTSDEPLRFDQGDTLVVDASDESIRSGRTSARTLAVASARGARLFSLPALHAKVICTPTHAVIGSANLSVLSRERLVECAVCVESPTTVASARAFIQRLARRSETIDDEFLRRISAIAVDRASALAALPRRAARTSRAARAWLVHCSPIRDHRIDARAIRRGELVAEAQRLGLEHELTWVRFNRASRVGQLAREGDRVLQIFRTSARAAPRVYRGATVVHAQRERGDSGTRLWLEESDKWLTWSAFRRIWRGATHTREPTPRSMRELPLALADRLDELWPRDVGGR